MILLLEYLAGLFSTFVAAMLSVILTVTTANKAPGHPYRSHMAQLSKHEGNKHRGNSRVARATAKDKSTSVVGGCGKGAWDRRKGSRKALRRFRKLRPCARRSFPLAPLSLAAKLSHFSTAVSE